MRILIIDDDPQLIRLAAFALRESGIAVTAATTSEEGLCLAASEPFDAVLLDVMMPEIDGPTVLARCRDAPSTHGLPGIFVSGMFRLEERNSPAAQAGI